MSQIIIPVDNFDYFVFGATGDLAKKKLLPALYYRFADGQIPAEARIIGCARTELNDSRVIKQATEAGLIRLYDLKANRKALRYIPFWA